METLSRSELSRKAGEKHTLIVDGELSDDERLNYSLELKLSVDDTERSTFACVVIDRNLNRTQSMQVVEACAGKMLNYHFKGCTGIFFSYDPDSVDLKELNSRREIDGWPSLGVFNVRTEPDPSKHCCFCFNRCWRPPASCIITNGLSRPLLWCIELPARFCRSQQEPAANGTWLGACLTCSCSIYMCQRRTTDEITVSIPPEAAAHQHWSKFLLCLAGWSVCLFLLADAIGYGGNGPFAILKSSKIPGVATIAQLLGELIGSFGDAICDSLPPLPMWPNGRRSDNYTSVATINTTTQAATSTATASYEPDACTILAAALKVAYILLVIVAMVHLTNIWELTRFPTCEFSAHLRCWRPWKRCSDRKSCVRVGPDPESLA